MRRTETSRIAVTSGLCGGAADRGVKKFRVMNMTNNSNSLGLIFLATVSSLVINAGAMAGEKEDALIAKIVDAYGGGRLTDARSLRFQEEYKNAFPGQGYTSGYVEFTPLRQDAQFDFANERASIEGWSANWNFSFNTRTVSIGDDIVAINYRTNTYQPAASPDYYTAFGPMIRSTDTLLAYELAKHTDSAEHQGKEMYIGKPHEILTFEIPNSPPLTLHVDAETGWISKMTRETGFGALTYQFRDHTTVNGVGYGQSFEFFVGDTVNLVTVRRDLSVNTVRPSTFRIDRGVEEEGERVDTSEMTVDEIAGGVHLAGTGNAYTMFVDAGDHIIGVGGYAGLADRFTAYKEAAGHDKPLRYQIATHHHTDHLGGMGDAFTLGAIFVTPENAVANISTAVGETVPEDRLQIIDGHMSLGPVEIHDIATSHAESYALAYLPSINTAFQADHYNGNYVDGPSGAGIGTLTLARAIGELGLDVDILLSAHGRKANPWAEVEAAIAAYDPTPCIGDRAICR